MVTIKSSNPFILKQIALKPTNITLAMFLFLLYKVSSYIDSSDRSELSDTIHSHIQKWSINAWNSH